MKKVGTTLRITLDEAKKIRGHSKLVTLLDSQNIERNTPTKSNTTKPDSSPDSLPPSP
jgi:hypothetical protein